MKQFFALVLFTCVIQVISAFSLPETFTIRQYERSIGLASDLRQLTFGYDVNDEEGPTCNKNDMDFLFSGETDLDKYDIPDYPIVGEEGIIENIKEEFKEVINSLKGYLEKVAQKLYDKMENLVGTARRAVEKALKNVSESLKKKYEEFKKTLEDFKNQSVKCYEEGKAKIETISNKFLSDVKECAKKKFAEAQEHFNEVRKEIGEAIPKAGAIVSDGLKCLSDPKDKNCIEKGWNAAKDIYKNLKAKVTVGASFLCDAKTHVYECSVDKIGASVEEIRNVVLDLPKCVTGSAS